jgi:transcriptional regulator with XRE-family HTH domain
MRKIHAMAVVSRATSKITWQGRREAANLLAVLAEQQTRVAERVGRLREAHALTQEAAAARAGVTLRQWQRWESGESEPYARNLAKLSEEFDVPLSELVGSEPVRETQLDSIERKLDQILEALGITTGESAAEVVADVAARLAEASASPPLRAPDLPPTIRAVRRRKPS